MANERPVFSAAFPPLPDGTRLINTADGKDYRRVNGKWVLLEDLLTTPDDAPLPASVTTVSHPDEEPVPLEEIAPAKPKKKTTRSKKTK